MEPLSPSQAIVIDRYLSHAPEKVWRALTEKDLLSQWLMTNDFQPIVGHHFHLRRAPMPHWDGVVKCEVLEVNPPHHLSYRWNTEWESQPELNTVVRWTLTPDGAGTLLRMEQTGFQATQLHNRNGAEYGWSGFLTKLDSLLGELE
ncbi:SRPBCC family protein [Deinococcus cellulosilyticus]|uniref:Activator of HSP90 ATPase n=1 Tax=Deinococcus cellulosilyticus (strain DSM 18568 / NBRC 106333 / KACC 11606 / 5516J-15) TaxID=1223518 RepID=A0A511N1T6_DEIC1|nr:SRPBCC domain-containing protein [Deinococcus cellulosilyticus]GEM46401.1 activator of HSP90 ATPase [Deinococcus cellulosilyticus NBRC 106333 = KACC 11606]